MTALTKQQKSLRTSVEKSLNVMKGEIIKALPKHMSQERFSRVVLTEVTRNPKLLDCDQTSFFCSLLLAAQMGLEPGVNGACYLLPFKVKGKMQCQFILGFRGMIDLARRSGAIESIHAEIVYEHDEFDLILGLNPDIHHKPKFSGDRGEIIGGYSVAQFKDGGKDFIWMTEEDFLKVKATSKNSNYGPWVDFPAEMRKKTLVRRHFKTLPVSMEIQSMAEQDEKVKSEFKEDMTEPAVGETIEEVEAQVIEEEEETRATQDDKAQFYEWTNSKGVTKYLTVKEKTAVNQPCEKQYLKDLMVDLLKRKEADKPAMPGEESEAESDEKTDLQKEEM